MSFGSFFGDALVAAGQQGVQALAGMGDAAARAADTAAALAQRAAMASAKAAIDIARTYVEAARTTQKAANAVVDFAARKTAAAGLLAGETVAVAGMAGAGLVTAKALKVYGDARKGYAAVKEVLSPHVPVATPCLPCMAISPGNQRRARIEKRQALIDKARHSGDPAAMQAAEQLNTDMKSVELAQLAENTYEVDYDPKHPTASPVRKPPPEPWKAMTLQEAAAAGLMPEDLMASKAVVYSAPPDFPFSPKTVLAFRGTTPEFEDAITDHDQALGLRTEQYDASVAIGKQVGRQMPNTEVTGHSLGGGKAQAAGVAGRLTGEMFNSAGLHPNTVGAPADGLGQYAKQFIQNRAEGGLAQGGGDPLTGLQNSMTAQQVAFGAVKGISGLLGANKWALNELGVSDPLAAVPQKAQQFARDMADRLLNITPQQAAANFEFSSGKWYVPPALGEIRGVTSKTKDGENTPILAQHSMTNVVYGYEARKAATIDTLLTKTGTKGPASDYIGPMTTK